MLNNASSSFSYTGTKIGLVLGSFAVIITMTVAAIVGINPNQTQPASFGGTQVPAPLTSLAAGCGDYFLYPPTSEQYGTILDEDKENILTIPSHPMIVPVYGYMSEKSIPDNEIKLYELAELAEPFSLQSILRTMYEKETTVVWYSLDINQGDFAILRTYARNNDNILVLPWQYGDATLPLNRSVAFSQWGVSQSCQFWTDETFESFLDFAGKNQADRTSAPKVVKPNEAGLLPPILVED